MLPEGIYERLLDEELRDLLAAHPELAPTFEKLDDEAEPHTFSQFVSQVLLQALPACKPGQRRLLVNRLLELLSAVGGLDYTLKKQLLDQPKTLLRQLRSVINLSLFPVRLRLLALAAFSPARATTRSSSASCAWK
jgi:hypothetical protein